MTLIIYSNIQYSDLVLYIKPNRYKYIINALELYYNFYNFYIYYLLQLYTTVVLPPPVQCTSAAQVILGTGNWTGYWVLYGLIWLSNIPPTSCRACILQQVLLTLLASRYSNILPGICVLSFCVSLCVWVCVCVFVCVSVWICVYAQGCL